MSPSPAERGTAFTTVYIRERVRMIGNQSFGKQPFGNQSFVALFRLPTLLAVIVGVATGCSDTPSEGDVPVPTPELRAGDGLVHDQTLRDVVELGLRREGAALRRYLDHDEARVRARAAFTLASVQDSGSADALISLLRDPEATVRGDAAFALGQIALPDGGGRLLEALADEEAMIVRVRLMDAIGRTGDEAAVRGLAELDPRQGEEEAWTTALGRAGIRGPVPMPVVEAMLSGLTHSDPDVRVRAAYFFGAHPHPEAWAPHVDRVREALDGYALDEEAAMHLVLALGIQRQRVDADRIVHRLEEAVDWRVRVEAARALGGTAMLETPGVRDALFRALGDESHHVGAMAALALTQGFRIPQSVLDRAVEWIQGSVERWPTHLPFLSMLAGLLETDAVGEWTRRMLDEGHPDVAAYGVELLAHGEFPGLDAFLLEMSEHEHPRIRGIAFSVLADRWAGQAADEQSMLEWHERFASELRDGPVHSALPAARALSAGALVRQGSAEDLRAAYAARSEAGEIQLVEGILDAMARTGEPDLFEVVDGALEHDDYRIRRAAAEVLERRTGRTVPDEVLAIPNPEVTLDWDLLAELGGEPRLRILTDRGELVVRLVPEQAPLTVQALVQQARRGLHDDVPIHRVEPGHLIQGGDHVMHDGTGTSGVLLRSEFTRIPFQRGIMGMASVGKDTETSQFFILQNLELPLDGEFTAFGWLEEGGGVLDRIRPWDRVVRVTVEASPDA